MSEGFSLPEAPARLPADDLRDAWRVLDRDERVDGFRLLGPLEAQDFFQSLSAHDQCELVLALSSGEQRLWLRSLAPDDAADLVQEAPAEAREQLLAVFEDLTRREVNALLAYAEDDAGGLMSPRFARVRPDMTVDEAILYLRRQAAHRLETIYYAYVLDRDQKLLGVVSFRDLFQAQGSSRVRDVMGADLVTVPATMDQEQVGRVFAQHDLTAIPVVDEAGRMVGIVTVDDIVDVVQEEATEDIQKIGGSGALDAPYLEVGFLGMLHKRAGWLIVLFLAQFLTTLVLLRYESFFDRLSVLAVFIPMIVSSGGNSGSQASTLVIRALALGEVHLRDWSRVLLRELAVGLALGLLLGGIGLLRIVFLPPASGAAVGAWELGTTVACSVLGVVLWGTISGSMLPFLLRRLRLDPAGASAPLVSTLVDVVGLLVYISVAALILSAALD
jgi:magnesium transporter